MRTASRLSPVSTKPSALWIEFVTFKLCGVDLRRDSFVMCLCLRFFERGCLGGLPARELLIFYRLCIKLCLILAFLRSMTLNLVVGELVLLVCDKSLFVEPFADE